MAALKHFQEIALDELEDQVNHTLLTEGLAEFDHVGVLEHLENFDFSGSGLADSLILLGLLEFLYCEHFLCIMGTTFEDYPIRPLADYPQNLVFLHAAL